MATKIIGRTKECAALKNCYESDKAELIAVYGRRRIGKTFLVKNFFRDKIDFYVTGILRGNQTGTACILQQTAAGVLRHTLSHGSRMV